MWRCLGYAAYWFSQGLATAEAPARELVKESRTLVSGHLLVARLMSDSSSTRWQALWEWRRVGIGNATDPLLFSFVVA